MRFGLLPALLLVGVAPSPSASAQGLFLPDGESGLSVSAGTTLNDGAHDLSAGITTSTARGLDLSLAIGQSPLGGDGFTSVSGAVALGVDREGPSRARISAGYGALLSDRYDPIHAFSIGAQAGRQTRLAEAVRTVPTVSVSVSLLAGDDVDGGLQTGAGVDLPVFFGGGEAEPFLAVSASLSSERVRFTRAADALLFGVRGGILF